MTEKELLKLAAKASLIEMIGYTELPIDNFYYQGNSYGVLTRDIDGNDYVWNPLTDDGDCARLEAQCGINVHWAKDRVFASSSLNSFQVASFFSIYEQDKNKARRWASVKVAAEICNAMGMDNVG